MSITVNDVKRVAHLARIKIDENEISGYSTKLDKIVHFVELLDEVDCSTVDDTVQYASKLHEREDIAEPCDPAVVNNASKIECNMFVVPKMV